MKLYLVLLLLVLTSCTMTTYVIYDTAYEKDLSIEAYFCPRDHCQERIIGLMDASMDIRCAFYDLDLPAIKQMLLDKQAQVVIEDSNALEEFMTGRSYALMHNKFCIFDNSTVLTGSMNPTERGNYYNNNNIVIIHSKVLASNYLDEFDELKENIYGAGDPVPTPEVYNEDTKIENYFCPEDNCKLRVENALKTANHTIYFMTYSFTDSDIGNLLWNKAHQGVTVKGIYETRQISDYSTYEDLRDYSILDHNKYTMHHKVFIIDNMTVITGSYNPTKNANEKNDENIIIIQDPRIALKYVEEFNRLNSIKTALPEKPEGVIMKGVMYDAEGSDTGKEYVLLKNNGLDDVILDYYFLSDNRSNMRLTGSLEPGMTARITPTFSLRNSEGELFLKKAQEIIDYVYYEGVWPLEASDGEHLERIDESSISSEAWQKE